MIVLDEAPETTPASSAVALRPLAHARACPECCAAFAPRGPRQIFCTPAHKRAFHNRATVRGAVLVPLEMASRITRGGSRGDIATGRRARAMAEQLKDRWAADDRAAGRMSMVDYIAARCRHGFAAL